MAHGLVVLVVSVGVYRVPGRQPTADEAALWSLAPLSPTELDAPCFARAQPADPTPPISLAQVIAIAVLGFLAMVAIAWVAAPLLLRFFR